MAPSWPDVEAVLDWSSVVVSAIALLSAAISTIGLKLVERWLNKSKDKDTSQLEMRNELRGDLKERLAEIDKLKVEIESLDKAVDEWRKKYYDVYEAYLKLKYPGYSRGARRETPNE